MTFGIRHLLRMDTAKTPGQQNLFGVTHSQSSSMEEFLVKQSLCRVSRPDYKNQTIFNGKQVRLGVQLQDRFQSQILPSSKLVPTTVDPPHLRHLARESSSQPALAADVPGQPTLAAAEPRPAGPSRRSDQPVAGEIQHRPAGRAVREGD